MSVDDLFVENSSGRPTSRLVEEAQELPLVLNSFEEWRDYNFNVLRYPMFVCMLMAQNMRVSDIHEMVMDMRKLNDNIFESFTTRYSLEYGLKRIDNSQFLCRFIDFNNDPMNYVRFVFWMTLFFHRVNNRNKQSADSGPFSNFTLTFSSKSKICTSKALVHYPTKNYGHFQYPAVVMGSIIEDIFIGNKTYRLDCDPINVHRLLFWINRMKNKFCLNGKEISHVIDSARKFGDGFRYTYKGGL